MAVQSPTETRGLIVCDQKLTASNRNTDNDLLATATQGGGTPGIPVSGSFSLMELRSSGEVWAGDTLSMRAIRGGHPIPGVDVGRFAWTGGDTEGATERGWLPYNVASGFFWLQNTANLDGVTYPGVGTATQAMAIRRPNGDVIFAFVSDYLGTKSIVTAQYDASVGKYKPSYGRWTGAAYTYAERTAWSWTINAVSNANAGGAPSCPFLLELPSGRLILFFVAQQSYAGGATYWAVGYSYSDNGGSTWTFATRDTGARITTGTGTPVRLQAAYGNGYITLILDYGGAYKHYYSNSDGASFTEITDTLGTVANSPCLIACDDGSWLMFYIKGGDGHIYFTRKYSAATGFIDETALNPGAGTSDNLLREDDDCLAACILEDRTIALMAVTADDGVNAPTLRFLRYPQSVVNYLDALYVPYTGNTLDAEPIDYGAGTGATQYIPAARSLAVWGSQLLLCFDPLKASTESACQFFGGYSSIDWNGPTFGVLTGNPGVQDRYGAWWDSAYKPSNEAIWTCAGAGAEGTSVEKLLSYDFSGGASTRYQTRNGIAGADVWVWARVRIDSGGALATHDAGLLATAANGATEYKVSVRLTTTAIRLYDEIGAATVGTDVTGLTSCTMLDVLVSLTAAGRATVWYKAATSQIWLLGPYGNPTVKNVGAAATSLAGWGCFVASTQKSTWAFVGTICDKWTWGLPSTVTEQAQARIQFGREFAIWPTFLADGCAVAAVSGPAATGETWTIAPHFAYTLDNLDPIDNPAPSLVWQSATDQAEQIIGWDLTATDGPDSALIGLYFRCPNFLTAVFEQDDGAGGWTTQATVSTVLISGGFVRGGYRVTASSSDLTGSYCVGRDELVGSWAVLTNGGLNYYVKIGANSQGTWNKTTGILTATFTITGDLTGLPTTGTIQIIAPEVTCIFKPTAAIRRYWRIRIAARTYASAPEAYHQLSVLLVGPYLPLGWTWSNAPTRSMEPIQTIAETETGKRAVTSYSARGRRTVSVTWTDAIPGYDTLGSTATPQAITATTGGEPIAQLADPRLVEDILLRTQGAKIPVVLLPYVPQLNLGTSYQTTVRARDLQLYGRLVNGSTRTEPYTREGVMQLTTISEARFEEEAG